MAGATGHYPSLAAKECNDGAMGEGARGTTEASERRQWPRDVRRQHIGVECITCCQKNYLGAAAAPRLAHVHTRLHTAKPRALRQLAAKKKAC